MIVILIITSVVLIVLSPLIFLYRKWSDRKIKKFEKITPHIPLDNKAEINKVATTV